MTTHDLDKHDSTEELIGFVLQNAELKDGFDQKVECPCKLRQPTNLV